MAGPKFKILLKASLHRISDLLTLIVNSIAHYVLLTDTYRQESKDGADPCLAAPARDVPKKRIYPSEGR